MCYDNILESANKFHWSSVSYKLNTERTINLNNNLIGQHILEAGCGGGGYSHFLAKKGYMVVGIDNSFPIISFAKDKCPNVEFIQSDIESLPFQDKLFDCSFCFDVLEHVNDKVAILELERVTKSRIIFAVPQEDSLFIDYGLVPFHYQDQTHLRYYSTKNIEDLLNIIEHKGFAIIHEGEYPLSSLFKRIHKYDNANQFITNLLIPSIRLGPYTKHLNNNNIIKRALSTILRLIFNQNKILRNIYDEKHFNKMYSGLFVIVDL